MELVKFSGTPLSGETPLRCLNMHWNNLIWQGQPKEKQNETHRALVRAHSLLLLEILSWRQEAQQIRTSVYRKPKFSGLGINYFSFYAFRLKINSKQTLLWRDYSVSAIYQLSHLEFEFLERFFHSNGFPQKLINTDNRKILSIRFEPTVSETIIKQKFYVSIPNFFSQSDRLVNELSAWLFNIVPQYDFVLIQVNRNKIGSFF